MNTIAHTLSSITSAVVLALAASPALGQDAAMASLVQRADGTLAIERGALTLDKAFGQQVLASTTDEVATFIEPIEEVDQVDEVPSIDAMPTLAQDPARQSQWGLTQLDVESVWGQSKGKGITVAVVDTGVDITHPDFEGRVIRGYTAPGEREGDFNGHGTHVAGIVGAGDNNNIGGTGVAPDVTIWEAKVTRDNGIGNSTWMAEGIVAAINANVDVINVSMSASAPMPLVEAAINQAVARNIPVIVAAGNEGQKGSPTRWPAAYANSIAVGSITRNQKISSFSNTNSYVDLTAPGSAIYSTLPGGGTGMMSGTSQAAPHVAGAAALLKSVAPSLSSTKIREVLTKNTDGPLNTLCVHASLAAVGFPRKSEIPAAPAPQRLIATQPTNPNAPKPTNPIRHFTRPER